MVPRTYDLAPNYASYGNVRIDIHNNEVLYVLCPCLWGLNTKPAPPKVSQRPGRTK